VQAEPTTEVQLVSPSGERTYAELDDRELLVRVAQQNDAIIALMQQGVQIIEDGKRQIEPLMNSPMFKGLGGFFARKG
jgi:hypothetical protein